MIRVLVGHMFTGLIGKRDSGFSIHRMSLIPARILRNTSGMALYAGSLADPRLVAFGGPLRSGSGWSSKTSTETER